MTALRDILTAVREGRLDPAEAARRLSEPPTEAAATPPAAEPSTGEASADTGDHAGGEAGANAGDGPAANLATGDVWADAVDAPGSSAGTAAGARPPEPPLPESSSPDATTASAGPAPPEPPAPPAPPAPKAPLTPPAATVELVGDGPATTSLRLRAMTRRVRVVADPSVSTISVEGPHELRREGTALILESDLDLPLGDPFAILPAMRGGFRLRQGGGLPLSLGSDLVVRLNPAIALDVDVTAGSLAVRGGSRVRARVTAGSARIEGVNGPIDLHVVGGTAKVDMAIRGRDNRIRCESGSISLRLRKESDVRLRPDAQLGRITVDGVEGGREIVVGAGVGRLDVEIVMGNLQVDVEPADRG